jgi:hypothetical protein
VSIVVKLSRVERLLNAAGLVPIRPKPDDPYLAKVRAVLAEERADGYRDGLEAAAMELESRLALTDRSVKWAVIESIRLIRSLSPAPAPTAEKGRCRCPRPDLLVQCGFCGAMPGLACLPRDGGTGKAGEP